MLEITVGESGFSSPLLACIWYSISPHVPKTIGKGLLLKILRDAELTKDELIAVLGARQLL